MARQGQVAAVRTVGHAAAEAGGSWDRHKYRLSLQGVQHAARPRVPDLERPIHAHRGELPTVRAPGHADDRSRVLQGSRVAVALPLEEMPLPAAQVLRAVVEQLLGAADVAG